MKPLRNRQSTANKVKNLTHSAQITFYVNMPN